MNWRLRTGSNCGAARHVLLQVTPDTSIVEQAIIRTAIQSLSFMVFLLSRETL